MELAVKIYDLTRRRPDMSKYLTPVYATEYQVYIEGRWSYSGKYTKGIRCGKENFKVTDE